MKTKKLLRKLNKYLYKHVKALQTLIKNIIKSLNTYKKQMKKIVFLLAAIAMCACGSTKVSVDRPAQGTSTTITVTTNNPISTEVNPNVELQNNK